MISSIRLGWRHARWVVVAAALPALWACNNRRLQAPNAPPAQQLDHYFEQNVNNDIDIVFMIDNSTSMDLEQANLARNFPTFINVLKSLPNGLPNVHIGILSSDLGGGAFEPPGCEAGGDRGAFQRAPRANNGTCTAVPRDNYIISLEGGTKNNFDGDLAGVFQCIAELGVGGCGFEHQLASVRRALGGEGAAPPENNGFLRDNAFLAVILITDEDDCSAPANSDLFDPAQKFLSDTYGPFSSYRCNEFGHLCGGVRPPRTSASGITGCQSAEGAGKLIPVVDFVNFFKSVKGGSPNKVIMAAITGPAGPYAVEVDTMGFPRITDSCQSSNGGASPGVRMNEFIKAFGSSGTSFSICQDNFSPAMDRIAQEIGKRLATQCMDGTLLTQDGTVVTENNKDEAECQVTDRTLVRGDLTTETSVPNCTKANGGFPCWTFKANANDCKVSGLELVIDRGPNGQAPSNTVAVVKCKTLATVM